MKYKVEWQYITPTAGGYRGCKDVDASSENEAIVNCIAGLQYEGFYEIKRINIISVKEA